LSDRKATRKRSMGVTLLLALAAVGLASATLAGRLGGFWWVADLFSPFAVYLTLAGAGLCMVTALFRRWVLTGLALSVLVVNAAVVWPAFVPTDTVSPSGSPVLRLAMANVWHRNRDSVRVGDFLRSCDADLVILQEVDPWWDRTLRDMDTPYRIAVSRPGEGSFGMALLVHERLSDDSDISLEGTRVFEFAEGFRGAQRPAIEATLTLGGRRVRLLGVHPPPPVSARNTALRDSVLRRVKAWADQQTDPHIILGDLNTTPWSYAFSILDGDGKLVSTQLGRGNQGTWPARRPLPWLLPIDHCLTSGEWSIIDRRIGEQNGSDHLPLVVSMALPHEAQAGFEASAGTSGASPDGTSTPGEDIRAQPATISP
jgi:endonuclease/exonuclease/phosphatase (EEP) superfamily protein YafD